MVLLSTFGAARPADLVLIQNISKIICGGLQRLREVQGEDDPNAGGPLERSSNAPVQEGMS